MRLTNYKKSIVVLVAISTLILGLYLEAQFPSRYIDVKTTDFRTAATMGLTRGEFYCSETADIKFVYPNHTNSVSLNNICKVLDDNYKKNL